MIFNDLSSEVIKAGVVSKLAFSLGFKMISTTLKAQQPRHFVFETGKFDDQPIIDMGIAKRKWATFTEWADTQDFAYSTIEEIAQAYVKSSGKPINPTPDHILELRAKASGKSLASLKQAAAQQEAVVRAKVQARVDSIIADLADVKAYANAWYHHDVEGEDGTLYASSMDIEQILVDEWVEQAYEAVAKAQMKYWERYNNWDDAELCLIMADKALMGL
jgi:hypothetical protein